MAVTNMRSLSAKEVFHQIVHPMPIRLRDVDLLARTFMEDAPDLSESEAYEYVGNSGIAKFPNVVTNNFGGTIYVVIPPGGPNYIQVVMKSFNGQIKIKGLLDEKT